MLRTKTNERGGLFALIVFSGFKRGSEGFHEPLGSTTLSLNPPKAKRCARPTKRFISICMCYMYTAHTIRQVARQLGFISL